MITASITKKELEERTRKHSRILPPITEPVSHEEIVNILLRELYSVKDSMDDETMQRLFTEAGITTITPKMVHAAFDNL